MNGCEGCYSSPEGQDTALDTATKQAREYAKENKTAVAIYKEGFEYKYIEAGLAFAGNYPICNIVSQYN